MWDNLQHPKLFANQVKIKYSNISLIFTILLLLHPRRNDWQGRPCWWTEAEMMRNMFCNDAYLHSPLVSLNHKIDGTHHSPLTTHHLHSVLGGTALHRCTTPQNKIYLSVFLYRIFIMIDCFNLLWSICKREMERRERERERYVVFTLHIHIHSPRNIILRLSGCQVQA